MSIYSNHLYQIPSDLNEEYLEEGFKDKLKEKFHKIKHDTIELWKDKPRMAARIAGGIGAHLAYNKAFGGGLVNDVDYGNHGRQFGRMMVSAAGADLGDKLLQKYRARKH